MKQFTGYLMRQVTNAWRQPVLLIFLVLLSCASIVAQEGPARQLNPVKWTLTAELPVKPLKAGDKFILQLTAEIDEGWHLYSTEEIARGPKPTRIVLAPDQPFELSGIESPAPRKELDVNFGVETEYYEQTVTFTLPFRVKKKAPTGTHRLTVQVRYQSCAETLCLPPRTVKLVTTVLIRNRVSKRTLPKKSNV